jgi:hypothetical protein
MTNKRKAEMARPAYSMVSASWSREEMASVLGKSLSAYDEAYRRGASMPPRFLVGRFWRHSIMGYEQWQREEVAKAEDEAKRLAGKVHKRVKTETALET